RHARRGHRQVRRIDGAHHIRPPAATRPGAAGQRPGYGGPVSYSSETTSGQSSSGPSAHEHVLEVFLVDDHEIVRRGLIDLLDSDPGLRVIGEAGDVESARTGIRAARPDVAVL